MSFLRKIGLNSGVPRSSRLRISSGMSSESKYS
uniref:Uncharacterized protein n=1 Tax=Rhizophora mucronata TaxID=61149 RepID=A0A2P2N973_RHIMU